MASPIGADTIGEPEVMVNPYRADPPKAQSVLTIARPDVR